MAQVCGFRMMKEIDSSKLERSIYYILVNFNLDQK